MPIGLAPSNTPLKVTRISAKPEVKKHLESLGITVNTSLTVIKSDKGSVIVVVKDGRLALDKDVARTIFVS